VSKKLAASVAQQGLLQPIVVIRRPTDGSYEIVVGNARYEACKALGWKTIPAIVREFRVNLQPECSF